MLLVVRASQQWVGGVGERLLSLLKMNGYMETAQLHKEITSQSAADGRKSESMMNSPADPQTQVVLSLRPVQFDWR